MKVVVENVSKKFKGTNVLSNINMELESGRIYGFQGRNGSGKSILLKIMCGLIKPSEGNIFYDGNLLNDDLYKYNVGALIENPKFFTNLSGFENLVALASIRNKTSNEKIIELLKMVDLYQDKDKKYGKYSLGMKQKLGFIQAVMEDQDIIYLDEVFNGIEKETVVILKEYLIKLKESGKLIVITSHISDDLEELCDTIYKFEDGTLK